MSNKFVVQQVSAEDADVVGSLVYSLLTEIASDYAGKSTPADYSETARTLLAGHPGVWAFLARNREGDAAGVLMLNACAAIYAGGVFGEISELYVSPGYRSAGVGAFVN